MNKQLIYLMRIGINKNKRLRTLLKNNINSKQIVIISTKHFTGK